jgi:hypothetical protein
MTGATAVPPWIHAASLADVTVVLDARTARALVLRGTAGRAWLALALSGSVDSAAAESGLDQAALQEYANRFATTGLLAQSRRGRPRHVDSVHVTTPPSWGTDEQPAQLSENADVRPGAKIRAALACTLTLLLLHLGRRKHALCRLHKLIRLAARSGHPASTEEAMHAVDAVRHVARRIPARFACLEESASAVVMLGMTGRYATWCHGVARDSLRFHTWIAVNGHAINISTSPYARLTQIPDRNGSS